jgi:hypothetical protein
MPDPKAVLDQMITLVQKANALGVAAETALLAFREKLFPSFSASGDATNEVFGTLPTDLKNDILECVEACQG